MTVEGGMSQIRDWKRLSEIGVGQSRGLEGKGDRQEWGSEKKG